jgi:DNA-binding LacI/PurR family transcriptional regulator
MARGTIKREPQWSLAVGKLKKDLLSNPANKGGRFPSLTEISKTFEVSVPTAVRVVSELEAQGLVRRVHGKGTFITGSAFPGTVKVVVNFGKGWPTHALPLLWLYLQGIQDACKQMKCQMSLLAPEHLEDYAFPEDRFIVIPKAPDDSILKMLSELKLRHVCLHSPILLPGVDTVRLDLSGGTRLEVEHLLGLGHRRIALLCGPLDNVWYASRPKVYMGCLEKVCIPFDPELVFETPEQDSWERVIHSNLKRLLALPDPPTAIAASDDLRALVALKCLKRLGVKVPEQMSLCGLDARSEAFGSSPVLTTGDWLLERQGEMAVRLLLEELPPGGRDAKDILVQPQLAPGESTAFIQNGSCSP